MYTLYTFCEEKNGEQLYMKQDLINICVLLRQNNISNSLEQVSGCVIKLDQTVFTPPE